MLRYRKRMLSALVAVGLVLVAPAGCSDGEPTETTGVVETTAATTTTAAPTTTTTTTTNATEPTNAIEASAALAATESEPPAPEELIDGLFVNLSTDDLDTAAMAIGFATKVIKNTGKSATIFLNVRGARLVDINIPQSIHKSGSTVHEMLQMFMDEGGTVLLCPVCMKNVAGLAEDEVLPGVIIGTPEYVYAALFAEGATVLSY